MKPIIVLPTYNPDSKLEVVIAALCNAGFDRIIVVNDGSSPESAEHLKAISTLPQCIVLTHEVNKGKGRALKTAMNYIIKEGLHGGVITVDGDNQHHIEDICAIAEVMQQDKESLILGARDFSGPNIPPRSRTGNRMTSRVFELFVGLKISDTQTGLRGIPERHLPHMPDIEGERFEYETNMLLATKKLNIVVREVPIRTIYIDDNATSHYRPLVDSLKIMRLMAKFMATSISTCGLDIGLYWIFYMLLKDFPLSQRVLWSTVIARIVSSVTNYSLNRKAVFKARGKLGRSLIRYYMLATVQMLCSYLGVWGLTSLLGGSVLMKLIVDGLLFFISFGIQRDWVFKDD